MFGKKGRKPAVINTLIGDSTVIEGALHFDGGCHVDGTVNGNVSSGSDLDACLSVSESGKIKGDVHVARINLSGTVEGNVVISERAELGATARVIGDVHYSLIEISAGAEINGKLIHVVEDRAQAALAAMNAEKETYESSSKDEHSSDLKAVST